MSMTIQVGSQVRCHHDGLIGVVVGKQGKSWLVWASDTTLDDPWTLDSTDFTVLGSVFERPAATGLPKTALPNTAWPTTPAPGDSFTVGTRVRLNSPRNYSFHGHTGTVTALRPSVRGLKAHVKCDPGQRRTGVIRCTIDLLEII